jgi:putative flavoprotein involved in K+ transport
MIILQASVLNNGEIMKRFKTVIIGGGQAGLSLSYLLQKLSHDHIVLDKAEQVADTWRNHRWDSFALVTPNWTFQMPGVEYHEECQDDYMPRDEIVKRLEKYVEQYALPVQHNTTVTAVAPDDSLQKGYLIHTSNETYHADNVVVATGLFQKAKTLPLSVELPPSILQLTSGQYRSPDALPPGAVLVVGSAQSGCQIVEDLLLDGRKVYLCVSKAGRAPRRYRGLDLFHWLRDTGFMDRTPDLLETPRQRFNPNPQVTGARGGHDINLHQFYRDGVVLLGRLLAYQDGKLLLSPDLHENLLRADRAEGELIKMIDRFIENNGIDARARGAAGIVRWVFSTTASEHRPGGDRYQHHYLGLRLHLRFQYGQAASDRRIWLPNHKPGRHTAPRFVLFGYALDQQSQVRAVYGHCRRCCLYRRPHCALEQL